MKHIVPTRSYEGTATYPVPAGISRRGALRVLATGLGAGAAALAAGRGARARSAKLHSISLPLAQRHYFSGCDYVLDRLDLQTPDGRLAIFLGDDKERAGLQAAAERTLRGTTCSDVTDRKRLYALEQRVGRALASQYRARTGRTAAPPIVTLAVTKHRPPVPGGISLPSRPVPHP